MTSSSSVLDQVDHPNEIQHIQSMIVLMRNDWNYHQVFYFVHFLISPIKVKRTQKKITHDYFFGLFSFSLDFKYPVHTNGYFSIPTTNGNQSSSSSSFTHSFGYSAFVPTLPIPPLHNHHHHHHHPPPAPVAYLLNENRTSNSKSSSSSSSSSGSSSNATSSSHRVLSSSKWSRQREEEKKIRAIHIQLVLNQLTFSNFK